VGKKIINKRKSPYGPSSGISLVRIVWNFFFGEGGRGRGGGSGGGRGVITLVIFGLGVLPSFWRFLRL
jgi:hypothetical protein